MVQCNTSDGLLTDFTRDNSRLTNCDDSVGGPFVTVDEAERPMLVNYNTTACYVCREPRANEGMLVPFTRTIGNAIRRCDETGSWSGSVLECDGTTV